MKKVIKIFLIVFFSSILLLTLSEIYLRFIGLGNPIIYKKNLNIGYLPLENQKVIRFKNSNITINENNYRIYEDKNYENKIIFLGDSVTYGGSYIDDKNLFSSKVCLKLNKIYERKFDCYNGGVNAYGFENILQRLKLLDYHDNDFIIITFILGNFYRNFVQIESLPYFTKKHDHILKANIELASFLIDKIRTNLRFLKIKNNFKNEEELKNFKKKIKKNLKALSEITNKNKNIIVIFSPSKSFYEKSKDYEIENYLFKNYTNNNNFYSINDLMDNELYKKIYYDGVHLNKYGHEIYSEIISKLISNKIKNE